MNGPAIIHKKIKSSERSNCGIIKICCPYMLYIHATTSGSWFSQKGKQKYWEVGDFTTTKNSYFLQLYNKEILINGYN